MLLRHRQDGRENDSRPMHDARIAVIIKIERMGSSATTVAAKTHPQEASRSVMRPLSSETA